MQKLILILLLCPNILFGQWLHLDAGTNLGGSILFHRINFEEGLNDLYQYDKLVFAKNGIDYTWDKFTEDHQLKNTITEPNIGFSAILTSGRLPFYIQSRVGSSTSSYTKFSFDAGAGVRYKFPLDSSSHIGIQSGYSIVKDYGFGNSTLVNSIGDDSIRTQVAAFFNPDELFADQFGRMFNVQVEYDRQISMNMYAGANLSYNLDVTPFIERSGRMTNLSMQLYLRIKIF